MTQPPLKHYSIRVQGIVQGVGFRPFIHRLAGQFQLAGSVRNDSAGVYIEVEGEELVLADFLSTLPRTAPPLAVIEHIQWEEAPWQGLSGFAIVESQEHPDAITPASPDIGICDDCRRELLTPDDRRYRYPFINCTNCGPRYTIIRSLPYDRPRTTMNAFTMCPACQSEYNDPGNRRFHAQPNACPVCGPRCELLDNQGHRLPCPDPVAEAGRLLQQGKILAVKGIGGFHLAADAANESAVRELRARKRRDEKPFALMALDLEHVRRFAHLQPDEENLLLSPQRPIVLLEKLLANPIAPSVSPQNRYFGIMLPYTPLHHLLLTDNDFTALVMTSGNFSEEPILFDNRNAVSILAPIADFFLVHNRDILIRNDDSICRTFHQRAYFLRRARGYAPAPLLLERNLPPILAVGAELKNTIALSRDNRVFVSQHIGDLENAEVFRSFETTVDHLETLFGIKPELLAYDLHPEYLSTKYAQSQEGIIASVGVQHHHAHIAACLLENNVTGPVIGLSLDGTGYGTDGKIWGGEVLHADLGDSQRLYHFRYVPMPGAQRAIREPWRMAIAYLNQAFGGQLMELPLPFMKELDRQSLNLVLQMLERRLNCPETSSCGRLFDGLAALSGLRQWVTFEGQAAMELEMCIEENTRPGYPFPFGQGLIEVAPAIQAAVADVMGGATPGLVSYRLHRGLVQLFTDICQNIRQTHNLDTVALSGGVFQNLWLLNHLHQELVSAGFRVLTHRLVPCNDGGISVGQLAVAAHRQKT